MYGAVLPGVPHEINSKPHSLTLRLERAPTPLNPVGMKTCHGAFKPTHSHSLKLAHKSNIVTPND